MGASSHDRPGMVGGEPAPSEVARISVIVPMLNEGNHVESLVDSLAAQDWAGALEVIVADGGSTDGSVERLTDAANRAGLPLELISNPAGWVSQGLNACIREASGDLIVRMDCHSRYPPDYLRLCADAASETGAWNVGGIVIADGRTTGERATAFAMSSAFGGIGWTRHAARGGRSEVDTVTYGAFRPEAFARAGLFDESLGRNQDDELNFRLRRAGGTIVLDPRIRTFYTPRGALGAVFRQYHEYGYWKVPVMLRHGSVLSLRSLAPLAFVGSLAVLAAAAPASPRARRLAAAELGLYGLCAVAFAATSLHTRKEPFTLLPRVAATFAAFHVGYGTGMLRGWARAFRGPSSDAS
jgi:succinoglycan biosynthesis protein ExoA